MMRAAIAALVFLASPTVAGECAYFNTADQRVDWDGSLTISVDPLYTDAYSCSLEEIEGTNGYTANCGPWSDTFVIGYSRPDAPFVDVVVWQNTFFWYKCAKDGA